MLKKLVAALVAATLGSSAIAQIENLLPEPGDKFVGISSQWLNSNGNDLANVALKLDYTVSPQFGATSQFMYLRIIKSDAWAITLLGKLLLAKEGATLPYIQAGGIYYDEEGANDFTYTLGAGVDHYIAKDKAFYLDFITFKPDKADDWYYLTTLGFKIKF